MFKSFILFFVHLYNLIRHHTRDVGLGAARSGSWPRVEKAFRAANPKCGACGTDKNLAVHHCAPFHKFPELELDLNNLITLCMSTKECHVRIGHGSDYKHFNPTVKEDAAYLLQHPDQFDQVSARVKTNRLVN